MEAEEPVEIDGGDLAAAGARDRDGGAELVVVRVSVGDNDVEAVGGAALEEHDEALVIFATAEARARVESVERPRQETGDRGGGDECQRSVLEENATRDAHVLLLT